MERLKHGAVVVELSKRSVEGNEKSIIDAWMADVVANGGYEKGESVGRRNKGCKRRRRWLSRGRRSKLNRRSTSKYASRP